MSGIYVLSDILKGGNKLEITATPEEKDVSDSPGNVAEVFATMLSGFMNLNVDSKGQNSKVSLESEEKQSTGNPVPSVQNPNGQGSMLGYGNFVLTNLFQPMLQSNLPAGKEANSGNDVEVFTSTGMTMPNPQGANPRIMELDKYKQVISELLVALSGKITDSSPEGAPLVLERGTSERQEMMKLVQSWLTVTEDVVNNVQAVPCAQGIVGQSNVGQGIVGQSIVGQGNNGQALGNLNEYVALPKVDFETVEEQQHFKKLNSISSNTGVEDLRQVIARMVQGLMQGTDKAAVGVPNSSLQTPMPYAAPLMSENELLSEQKVIKLVLDFLATEQGTGSRELNMKASSLRGVLNQILSEIQETKVSQEVVKELFQVKNDKSETLFNQPKSVSRALETTAAAGKETFLQPDVKQNVTGVDLGNSKLLKSFQRITREEPSKGVQVEATGLFGVKATQNQDPSVGIGTVGNITLGNVTADGKTVAIPVWEQVANVFRQQITTRHQELKELDIKLHPADLGRIQIGLRWENGQVHLIVHASEAATGQLLQNQLLELRHTLTNQGVNCGTLQMGQPGGDQQQNRHGNESRGALESDTNVNEDEEVSLGANSFSPGQDGNNRINVTA